MADDISKTSKQTIEAIDRVSNKLEEFYKKANKTSYFKSIISLGEEIDGLTSNFSKLEDNFEKLGISSEKHLGSILGKTNELQKKFKSFSESSKSFAALQTKMSDVQKTFGMFNKNLKTSDLKEFKDILNSLGEDLDLKSVSELRKELDKALDSGNADIFKKKLQNIGPTITENIAKKLQGLKKDSEVFSGLSKESQDFIENFGAIDSSRVSEELLNGISNGMSRIASEMQAIDQKKFEELALEAKEAQEETQKAAEGLTTQNQYNEYFETVRAKFNDLKNHINRQRIELGMDIDPKNYVEINENLSQMKILEDEIINLEEERKTISEDQTDLLDLNNKKLEEARKKYNEINKTNDSIFNFQEKYNKALSEAPLNKYSGAWVSVEDRSIAASAQIKNIADITSKKFPKLGKMIESVSDKFKLVGANAAKFKFGAGLITGGFTLLKALTEIEKKTAPTFKEINSSGLLVGKSTDEIGSSMQSLAHQTNNVVGLFNAARKTSGTFALSQQEILGTVSALDKAGLASRNLEGQMGNVMSSISGTGNELVGAATMVRTFSTNLGVADAEVANLMGNMAAEFNSTMGSLQDDFTGITSAMQSSSMSSTRFLGILGTSTAGMSIYAEQVEDTAKAIARLDRNTNLSQKGIEKFTKGAAEAAQNSELMATNMAIYLRGNKRGAATDALKKSSKDLTSDITALEDKRKKDGELSKADEKLLGELKGQKYATEEMSKYISKGDFFNASQFADRISPDANIQIQSMMLDEMMKQAGGNEALAKQLAKGAGMDGMMGEVLKLAPDDRKKLIEGLQKGDNAAIKKYEELQKTASEVEKYTGEGLGKLIESIGNTTNFLLAGVVGELTLIGAMMAGLGGLSGLKNLKDIFSKGGGNYRGGGGGKSIGLIKDIASSGRKGIGGLIDSSKNFIGNIGKSVGGGVLGKVGKAALKKIPLVGALLGGGMAYASAKEEGDSESKARGKGIGATAGAIIGGAIGAFGGPLGIAAGAFIGEMAGEAIGGYIGDAMDDSKKEIPKPAENLQPSSYKPTKLGEYEKAQAMKQVADSGNSPTTINNEVTININEATNLKLIQRTVNQAIYDREAALKTGTSNSRNV